MLSAATTSPNRLVTDRNSTAAVRVAVLRSTTPATTVPSHEHAGTANDPTSSPSSARSMSATRRAILEIGLRGGDRASIGAGEVPHRADDELEHGLDRFFEAPPL